MAVDNSAMSGLFIRGLVALIASITGTVGGALAIAQPKIAGYIMIISWATGQGTLVS
ncbi:MAG: hypothetical protein AB1743_10755 [Actinomycetota bacterium]